MCVIIYVNSHCCHMSVWQNYFSDAWNVFDFVIVFGSFIDIIYTEVNVRISCTIR